MYTKVLYLIITRMFRLFQYDFYNSCNHEYDRVILIKISISIESNSLFLKFFNLLIKNSIERFTSFSERKKYDSFLSLVDSREWTGSRICDKTWS